MAKKLKQPTDKDRLKAGFYKGYDISWLRKLGEEHPDFPLVAEFDELQAPKKKSKKKK